MFIQRRALVACCDCGDRRLLARLMVKHGLTPSFVAATYDAVSQLQSGSICGAFIQDDHVPGDTLDTILTEAGRMAVPIVVCSRLNDPNQYLEPTFRTLTRQFFS